MRNQLLSLPLSLSLSLARFLLSIRCLSQILLNCCVKGALSAKIYLGGNTGNPAELIQANQVNANLIMITFWKLREKLYILREFQTSLLS